MTDISKRLAREVTPARLLIAALCWLPVSTAAAQSNRPLESFWVTNEEVRTVKESAGTVYLGGSFTQMGPWTGPLVRIDGVLGLVDPGYVKVQRGAIFVMTPDGAGGWYVGGSFSTIGGVSRANVARVLSDGRISSWNPGTNGVVRAIAVAGNRVYIGGNFTNAGGLARNWVAAVDAATGAVDATWNPNAGGGVTFAPGVYSILPAGSSVYVGGDFSSIGGQFRNRIARVNTTTGAADAVWNPNAGGGEVRALILNGTTLLVGGNYTGIGGQPRNFLAALNTSGSGTATAWSPQPSGAVYTMQLSGTTLYVGGFFTTIGSPAQPRNRLAAVDTVSGAATAWNPNANSGVYSLVFSGALAYFGGSFSSVGGQPRSGLAAVDASSGALDSWNPAVVFTPGTGPDVYSLGVASGQVFAGGNFWSVNVQTRRYGGAVDGVSGTLNNWNPDASARIYDLAISGSSVYAGGQFTTIGGQTRPHLAELDATTGAATSWNANSDDWVEAIEVSGTRVIVGGWFNNIGNPPLPRNYIAALDRTSGANLWAQALASNDFVFELELAGSTAYVGGQFSFIGGQSRNNIAALDVANAAASSWNPNVTGAFITQVRSIAASAGPIYFGGAFLNVNGVPRNRLAAVDPVTAVPTAWNPNPTSDVLEVRPWGGAVLVGGFFGSIGGLARRHLASIDAATGNANPWNPDPDQEVDGLAIAGNRLYVGGDFDNIGGQKRTGFAAFCLTAPPSTLTATASGDNSIDLSWTPVLGASSYNLYRARVSGGPYELIGSPSGASFVDYGAEGGVTHYYIVRAVDGCESDFSNEASASSSGICGLPPDFDGVAWGQVVTTPLCQAQIGWAAATAPCGGGVTYSVYRSTSSSFVPSGANRIATGLSATSYTDRADLLPPGTYYYVVRATSTASGLEETNAIRFALNLTSCSSPGPAPVSFFTVTSTSGQNKLEWLNPPSGPYTDTMVRFDAVPGSSACTFPTATSGTLLVQKTGALGAYDSVVHSPLLNDNTTYCYSVFVEFGFLRSDGRFARGRPFDTSGKVKWAYSTGAATLAPPGVGPAVYSVSNDRVLHAMNRGAGGGDWPQGPPAWTPLAVNAPSQSRPPVVPTTAVPGATRVVFMGAQDGRVYAVNALTGAPLWQSPGLGMVQAAPAGIFQQFGGAYDYILIGTRNSAADNKFYALRVSDGVPVGAAFDNGGGANGIGIISGMASVDYPNRRVYFASRARAGGSSNTLWCLNLTAAGVSLAWARALGNIDGSPVLRGGRVYVGTNNGRVHAFDANDGTPLWMFDTGLGEPIKGYLFPDGSGDDLYFSTTTRVFSISDMGASGVLNWSVDSIPNPSIPLFTPGSIYVLVGGSDGRLYQLDVSGSMPTITSVQLGDGLAAVGSPSLDVVNGMVYVGTDAGIVYAAELPIP
jgi:outer membrane protein assembly factor BamB